MKEGDHNPILAVPEGLPPGIVPLLPEADTAKYRAENFNHGSHTPDDLRGYGIFVITLALYAAPDTGRTNFMPTTMDFQELLEAGYGMGYHRLQKLGGIKALQRNLGFYPDGYHPEQEELLERLRWMAQYALKPPIEFKSSHKKINQVIQWGADRNLLPARDITLDILGDARVYAQRMFGIETRSLRTAYSYLDVYRFGARVIRENDGPLTRDALDQKYPSVFNARPGNIIKAFFGTLTNFWLQFDRIPESSGVSDDFAVTLGVRHAIKTGELSMKWGTLSQLIKEQKVSSKSIKTDVRAYRQKVTEGYQAYLDVRDRYTQCGITAEVFQAACQKFEPTLDFEYKLWEGFNALHKLSSGTPAAHFILAAIRNGFDLEDERIFERQHRGLERAMRDLGIAGEDRRFIFDLIPRVDADEMLALPLQAAS